MEIINNGEIDEEIQEKLDCLTLDQIALLFRCCPLENSNLRHRLVVAHARDEFPKVNDKEVPCFVPEIKDALRNKNYELAIELAKVYA